MTVRQLLILVITDDENFLAQVHRELTRYELVHLSPDYPFDKETVPFDYAIIDAHRLTPESRYRISHLGTARQKIAIADPLLNNLLAKIHKPNTDGLRDTLKNSENMALKRAAPRGLKEDLSDLPYG